MAYSIIIDTNVVFNDFFFKSKNFKELFKFVKAKSDSINLCITEFNYHEILKKYKDEIRPAIKKVKDVKSILQKNKVEGIVDFENLNVNAHVDIYKEFLDETIKDVGIKIINYPCSTNISSRISNKYFKNIKPFDENKLSFQDAIIWESILEYCGQDEIEKVVFISNNYKDFSNSSKDDIHEHLRRDIPQSIEFSYYLNLESFLETEEEALKEYFMENEELVDYFLKEFGYSEEKLHSKLESYIKEEQVDLESTIESFVQNNHFSADFIEGWGSGSEINEIKIDIMDYAFDKEEKSILISFIIEVNTDFYVQTIDPTYERGDIGDGFLSEEHSGTAHIESSITYYILDEEFADYVELSISMY